MSSEKEQIGDARSCARRQLALRLVVGVYATVAVICLVVAVALGDIGFIVTSAVIALLASLALWRVWSMSAGS
jgi:hypothetical protein